MKEYFEKAELELVVLDTEEIITSSPGYVPGENELPPDWNI